MKKTTMSVFMFLVSLSLSGCIQFDTVIKVKPDGSGFIEETFLMRKDFLGQMQAMAEDMAKEMGKTTADDGKEADGEEGKSAQVRIQSSDFFNEAKLKEKAREMGEGVSYVSSSKIDTQDYEGFKAVYAFTDINKVKIKQDVKGKIPAAPTKETSEKREDITFVFTGGKPAELVIKLPAAPVPSKTDAGDGDKEPAQASVQPPEEMKAFMAKLFEGMKMSLAVEVDGTILETNAAYRDGSKITLLQLDFGKLIKEPEQLQKINRVRPETLEDIRKLMKDFPGIKVELNDEVKIKFE